MRSHRSRALTEFLLFWVLLACVNGASPVSETDSVAGEGTAGRTTPGKAGRTPLLPLMGEPETFGLYINGDKAGWMSIHLHPSEGGFLDMESRNELSIRVPGTGEIRMTQTENRRFRASDGELLSIDFELTQPGGEMKISVRATGETLTVKSLVAGYEQTSTQPNPHVNVYRQSVLETSILENKPILNTTVEYVEFDPSTQRPKHHRSRLVARETLLLNGVETPVYRMETEVVEDGMTLTMLVDSSARLLEGEIARMIRIRREPPEMARRNVAGLDFLRASVLKVPSPLEDTTRAAEMRATFRGVDPALFRTTPRQRWVEKAPLEASLVVRVEPVERIGALPVNPKWSREFGNELKPTPLFQSDDPAVRALAREIAGNETDAPILVGKLLQWVYSNIAKVYTPALSNASQTLQSRRGDCGEHAALFIALCRALGIPAMQVTGLFYLKSIGGFGLHAWARVYLGEWVEVDPTFNQFPADPTHILFNFGEDETGSRVITLPQTALVVEAKVFPK